MTLFQSKISPSALFSKGVPIPTHPSCLAPAQPASSSLRFAKKTEEKEQNRVLIPLKGKKKWEILLMKYSTCPFGSFFPDNCSRFAHGTQGIIAPNPGDKGRVTLPVVIPALERNLGRVSHKSPVLHIPTSRSHVPKLGNILGMGFTAFQSPFPAASGAEPGFQGSAPQGRAAKSPKSPQHLKSLGLTSLSTSQSLQHSQPRHSRENSRKRAEGQSFFFPQLINY